VIGTQNGTNYPSHAIIRVLAVKFATAQNNFSKVLTSFLCFSSCFF
jgi:hypothetical protein